MNVLRLVVERAELLYQDFAAIDTPAFLLREAQLNNKSVDS